MVTYGGDGKTGWHGLIITPGWHGLIITSTFDDLIGLGF